MGNGADFFSRDEKGPRSEYIQLKGTDRVFEIGRVHVQVWSENSKGEFIRLSNNARSMSNAEMKKSWTNFKRILPTHKIEIINLEIKISSAIML